MGRPLDAYRLAQARSAVYRERCLRSFHFFVKEAWPIVEPAIPLVDSLHVGVVAGHLQAVIQGEIPRLAINVPPGHAKSLLTSVLLPAWVWAFNPGWRGLFASYHQDLSTRDSIRCRALLNSEWYQSSFVRGAWTLLEDNNRKDYFSNTAGGFRLSLSVGGKGTGFRGHCLVIDDPISVQGAWSKAERLEVIRWFGETMSTRFLDPRTAKIILIMQRLHDQDLTGHVIQQQSGAPSIWTHLCLRTTYSSKTPCKTPIWEDTRAEGELLFPAVYTSEVLAAAKIVLGSAYHGQFEQNPLSDEAIVFPRPVWRFWHDPARSYLGKHKRPSGCYEGPPLALPARMPLTASVDAAFKDTKDSSYVVIQVWGKSGPDFFLVDQVRAQLSFTNTIARLLDILDKHKVIKQVLIEDKANGSAIIDALSRSVAGIQAVNPGTANKLARARAVSPLVEAGNVYLPEDAPWLEDFLFECERFPVGDSDDQVDAMSQALGKLASVGARLDRIRPLFLP